jgi:hypothetical protein
LSTVKTIGRKPERPDSSSINAVKLFIRSHNETLSIAAMRVRNPDLGPRSRTQIGGYNVWNSNGSYSNVTPAYGALESFLIAGWQMTQP